jgi:hypothetical protein
MKVGRYREQSPSDEKRIVSYCAFQDVLHIIPRIVVVKRHADSRSRIDFLADEVLTHNLSGQGWRINSVTFNAIKDNRCPLEAGNQAISENEQLHSLVPYVPNKEPVSHPDETFYLVEQGDKVTIEGKRYRVQITYEGELNLTKE